MLKKPVYYATGIWENNQCIQIIDISSANLGIKYCIYWTIERVSYMIYWLLLLCQVFYMERVICTLSTFRHFFFWMNFFLWPLQSQVLVLVSTQQNKKLLNVDKACQTGTERERERGGGGREREREKKNTVKLMRKEDCVLFIFVSVLWVWGLLYLFVWSDL